MGPGGRGSAGERKGQAPRVQAMWRWAPGQNAPNTGPQGFPCELGAPCAHFLRQLGLRIMENFPGF